MPSIEADQRDEGNEVVAPSWPAYSAGRCSNPPRTIWPALNAAVRRCRPFHVATPDRWYLHLPDNDYGRALRRAAQFRRSPAAASNSELPDKNEPADALAQRSADVPARAPGQRQARRRRPPADQQPVAVGRRPLPERAASRISPASGATTRWHAAWPPPACIRIRCPAPPASAAAGRRRQRIPPIGRPRQPARRCSTKTARPTAMPGRTRRASSGNSNNRACTRCSPASTPRAASRRERARLRTQVAAAAGAADPRRRRRRAAGRRHRSRGEDPDRRRLRLRRRHRLRRSACARCAPSAPTSTILVPNRFTYGYGLSPEIVDLAAAQPDLLITVDNGIASVEGVAAPTSSASRR
jgi:hypothetical protein